MVVELSKGPATRGHEEVLMTRVAHDLRSPLTAVKTSLGVVLANLPRAKQGALQGRDR